MDESSIEIGESEERLNVLDLPRLRPIDDCLDFRLGHGEAVGAHDVSEVLHGVGVKFAFVCAREEVVFLESP